MAARKDNTLSPKEEAFALAYLETGSAAEAYRRAYDVKAAGSHGTVYVAASRLLQKAKIVERISALQDQAAEMCLYTVKDAFTEYEQARQLALQEANPSAATAAVNGKVKLFGLDQPTKVDHTTNGKDIPASDGGSVLDRINGRLDSIAAAQGSGDGSGGSD